MPYLIDTNVFSERMRPKPDPKVLAWLEAHQMESYTSTHVIAEIQAGICSLAPGARRRTLQRWLNRTIEAMEGRILNFNTTVAIVWGQQDAALDEAGISMGMPDSFIAATARRHSLTIVTRNTADFDRPGLRTLNPAI